MNDYILEEMSGKAVINYLQNIIEVYRDEETAANQVQTLLTKYEEREQDLLKK